MINKNPNAQKIKARLVENSITYVDIARMTGNSQTTVSIVINYYPKRKSRKIQKAIATALNMPYEQLWPEGDKHDFTSAN